MAYDSRDRQWPPLRPGQRKKQAPVRRITFKKRGRAGYAPRGRGTQVAMSATGSRSPRINARANEGYLKANPRDGGRVALIPLIVGAGVLLGAGLGMDSVFRKGLSSRNGHRSDGGVMGGDSVGKVWGELWEEVKS